MEALQSLGINWRALVSQVVNFLILLVLLRMFLYKPILNLLEQRKAKIEKGLEDAQVAEQQLHDAQEKSNSIIKQANHKAQSIVAAAEKQAKDVTAKETATAKEKSQQIITSAKKQAEVEKAKAILQAKAAVGTMVALSTEKIIREKSDADSLDKIISGINE